MKYQLHHGDCLAILPTLEDCSVDAIVTDPPYGISYQSARRTDATKRKDKIVNDDHPFVWFLWDSARVLKDDSFLVCFCEWRHQDAFRNAIRWAGLSIKGQGVWDRCWHGMGDLKGQLAPQHDLFWLAGKGKPEFYGRRLKSVLSHQRVSAECLVHPTEKPVSLMREICYSVTPPGGTILDPFTGSGSTGKAAIIEDFKFIGIEREADYIEIAKARLEAAVKYRSEFLF